MKRALKITAAVIAVLVLVVMALGWYVTGTNAGLRWALNMAERATGGNLSVAEAQGNLLQGVHLQHLRYRAPGTEVEVATLKLRWRPSALLHGTVDVRTLQARAIRIRTEPSDEPSDDRTFPPQLDLPIRVTLQQVLVEDLRITQGQQAPVIIERIALDGGIRGDQVNVAQLQVRTPQLQASAAGELQLSGQYQVNLTVDWLLQDGQQRWQGRGTIVGDRNQVQVNHALTQPMDARLQAQVEDVFERLTWQADLHVPAFDADELLRQLSAAEGGGQTGEPLPEIGRVQMDARLRGDQQQAVLEQVRILLPEGARSVNLQGRITELQAASPQADLNLAWRNLQWPLKGQAQFTSAQGEGRFQGWLEQFQVRLDAAFSAPTVAQPAAQYQLHAVSHSDGETLQISELRIGDPAGDANLHVHGSVKQWRSPTPRFDLKARWQQLQWPLQGAAQYSSASGNASLQGDPDRYSFDAKLHVAGDQVPAGQWHLNGSGDRAHVEVQTLRADVLAGQVQGSGSFAWQGTPRWQANIGIRNLDPGEFDPAWRGSLSGSLESAGSVREQGVDMGLTVNELQGTLRERAFRATAKLQVQGEQVQIDRLDVSSGEAHLEARGLYAEQLDLSAKLDAADLGDLLPQASGSLHASANLQGSRAAPQLTLTVRGTEPRWQDYGAGRVEASVQGGVGPGQALNAQVNAEQLSAGAFAAQQLSVRAAGSAEQHEITIALSQVEGDIEVGLAGSLQEQTVWQGELRTLVVRRDQVGTWRMPRAAPLVAAADHASIEGACLQQEEAGLCVSGKWRASDGWSGQAQLHQLPLASLRDVLPDGVQVSGTVNGNADLAAGPKGLTKADAQLHLSPGTLRYQVDAERTIDEKFQGGTLRVEQRQQQLHGSLQIALAGSDRIDGQARVDMPGAEQDWSQSAVQAQLQLQMARLQVVEVFAPQISGLEGTLRAQLRLDGALGEPRLSGDARLQAPKLELPELGTVLTELDLHMSDAPGGALALRGSARSGGGRLQLQGRFEPEGGNPWRAQMQITGDRFLAVKNQDATVYVSPDLQVKAQPKRIDLQGSLTVPEAHLTPREGRSAVKPSSDVVVIRDDQAQAEQEAGWVVYAHLNLTLGDKVRFTGYGFDGRVSGGLVLNDVPNKVTTATGSVNIDDATYTAYGKTLAVDRGRLTFSGNPVTNPGLDLVASRTVDDKRVGVMVGGTAANPQLELFSNPSMSEGDILAYLVLGRPLNSAGEADKSALMAAASSFGLAKGSALAESIGHQLGFEDVSISSGGDANQAWLTVGRYLTPKLYVSYGVGLFEPGNIVRVRYDLTERWKVQGESGGSASGADILYTIER